MKFLLRSVHGYPLVGESDIRCERGWAYVRYVCLFKEENAAFVGWLAFKDFPDSVCAQLRKRGFKRSAIGWRIKADLLDENLE